MNVQQLVEELGLQKMKTTSKKVEKILDYFWKTYNTHNPHRDYREFVTWEEKGQREKYLKEKRGLILKIGAKSWGKKKVTLAELRKFGFGGNYDTNDTLALGFLPHTCTSASYIAFDLLDACGIKVRVIRGDLEGTLLDIPRKSKYAFNLNNHTVVEYSDNGEWRKFDPKWEQHPRFFRDKSGNVLRKELSVFRFEPWEESKVYYFVNVRQEHLSRYLNVMVVKSNFGDDINQQ